MVIWNPETGIFTPNGVASRNHDLDEAELKPYLQLDRMIEAAFSVANRLFGLEFAPLDVPLYHETRAPGR